MRVTRADIQFAEQAAFKRVFPSGLARWQAPTKEWLTGPSCSPLIHQCVNAHANTRKLAPSAKRYIWSNTLWIIRSRIRRGEEWRTGWAIGPSAEMHHVIVARIMRRLYKHGVPNG